MIAAADTADTPQRIRNAAVIRLLIHNGLRVDEATSADVTDLGYDRGHRTLTIVRKGGCRARVALAPATGEAIDTYLRHRADSTGVVDPRQLAGPLLVTAGGARLTQSTLWRLVRSLARTAGIPAADRLSLHSLRHTAITLALDAGFSLRDVQDYAGHEGHPGATLQSSAAGSTPTTSSSDKSLPGPANRDSTTPRPAA